jgi:hypothetical protein
MLAMLFLLSFRQTVAPQKAVSDGESGIWLQLNCLLQAIQQTGSKILNFPKYFRL